MSPGFAGRRVQTVSSSIQVQTFPFSSHALSQTNVGSLKQIWKESIRSAAEAVPSPQADIGFCASRLRRAIQLDILSEGKRAHFYIILLGLDQNILLGNLLIQMYGFCGAVEDARASFTRMQSRNSSSWSLLIRSYARYAYLNQALCMFSQMQNEIMLLDNASISSVLSACSGKKELFIVQLLHAYMIESCLPPTVSVSTSILSIYGRSGCLEDAELIFESLNERDVVCWNAMIAAFISENEVIKAFHFYYRMISEGLKPERSTYLSILVGCASQEDIMEGRLAHASMLDYGLESDVGVANALINMYGNCNSLKDAQSVFEYIPVPNVVSWNSTIDALVHSGHDNDALKLFEKMQKSCVSPSNVTFINILSACSSAIFLEQGQLLHHFIIFLGSEADVVVTNSLVNMYGKCGEVRDAKVVFEKFETRDRVSWTSMLTILASCPQKQDVLQFYDQMLIEGVLADRVTFVSMSLAFTDRALISDCKRIHARILSSKFIADVSLDNSLITMYGKCGHTGLAEKTFKKMRKHDLMSWNAIFSAYLQNGMDGMALSFLDTMNLENIYPDKFLCSSILTACANTGIQDRGKQLHIYVVMNSYDMDLTVGNAILNMYGKFGNLDDAFRIFERMAERDVISWSAMIGAFAQQGEGKIAVDLYNKMLEEGVNSDKVALVHLLSACSHDGLVDEVGQGDLKKLRSCY
ncbi:hypothetical protein KP509_04G100100 [Ceratopteris richardii]|uniref:Pentatricopeptide repeat-containing protein n=1 Tax=Ceratopteris richardii TaxID=49495 RepID=A0A8T2UYJ7_CERRI|nr:hypothetical protein KP509_04G100100 [Ceratopteris richardii]